MMPQISPLLLLILNILFIRCYTRSQKSFRMLEIVSLIKAMDSGFSRPAGVTA